VDIRLGHGGGGEVLTILADTEGGITLEKCAEINRRLGTRLDEWLGENASGSYTLEVNSPGLDRPLKTPRDFSKIVGKKLRMSVRNNRGAVESFVGALGQVREDGVLVEGRFILFSNIVKAVREISFK
jgi:ribosome maturation factor RimP